MSAIENHHIHATVSPLPDGSFETRICAPTDLWSSRTPTREQVRAVAVAAVRGIVRLRRLRRCVAARGEGD